MFSFVFFLLLLYIPDVMSYSFVPTINSNAYITLVNNKLLAVMHFHFLMKCILLFNMVPPVASAPNYYDYDRLPAMHDNQDNKVIWDGIPSPYFVENFYQPLQNSLGGVSENGHTLLVTAFDNDAGGFGPNAVPNYAIATAQIRAQHDNRVRRLFSCIMNYILAGCSIYIYLQNNFNNDGIAAFRYIRQYGAIPFDPCQIRKMNAQWEGLNLHSARIKIDNKSLFKLVEIIKRLARRLNKSNIEQKQKFLMALPQQLSHIRTTQMQNRAHVGYAFPGFYPPYFPVTLAGNAHPFAGQPDIEMLCKIINPEFLEHVNETTGYAPVRQTPKGLVSEVDIEQHINFITDDDTDPVCTETTEDVSAIDIKHINDDFECNFCGGKRHAIVTRVDGNKVVTCASKLLGMKPIKRPISQVDDSDIAAIRKFMRKANRKHDKRKNISALSLTTDSDAESTNGTSKDGSNSDSSEEANTIAASAAKSIMRKR